MGGLAWRNCSPPASDGIRAAAMLLPILAEDVHHDWIRWLSCQAPYEAVGRGDMAAALGMWPQGAEWVESEEEGYSRAGRVQAAENVFGTVRRDWQEFTLVPGRLLRRRRDGDRPGHGAGSREAGRQADGWLWRIRLCTCSWSGWTDPAADQPSRHRTVVAGARHLTAARALSAGRVRRGGMMRQDHNVEVAREAFAGWSRPRGQMPVLRRLATWPADLESNLRGLLSAQLCYLCGARKNDDMITGSTAARCQLCGISASTRSLSRSRSEAMSR